MFRHVDELPADLRRFAAESASLTLPFTFAGDAVGTAIIRIAAGKTPLDLLRQDAEADATVNDDLRSAAQRFVAKVMLSTGSDLFTVLGVSSTGDPGAYRDNYRRLMAMVHPDARPTGFPNDAAIRVNHAYAVLSDAQQLENYKVQRAALRTSTLAISSMGAGGRSQQASRPISAPGFTGRIGALLFRARERGLLLWLALLLLVPVGGAFYFTLSENPHVRLVEAGSKLGASPVTAAIAPPVTTALTAPTAPVTRVNNKVETESPENAGQKAARKQPSEMAPLAKAPSSSQPEPTPALVFETSLSMSKRATLVQATSNVPSHQVIADPYPPPGKGSTSLAPVASITSANVDPPIREANVDQAANVATVRSASTAVATAMPNAPNQPRLSPADAGDVLVTLSNAYESGSMAAFSKVFAPTMTGRRQVLSDYERVFQQTRQRSIRFTDFKHKASGQRIETSGYAIVSTVDNDNRVSRHRIFLEIEISRTPDGLKIERLHNFPLN